MKLTLALPTRPCADWRLARQVGAEGAVFGLLEHFKEDPTVVTYSGIGTLIKQLREHDLELSVIEGDPVPLEQTRLGLPGRDAEIARYLDVIKVLGDHGIGVMCPNFMAGVNWTRTDTALRLRGGALTTAFRAADLPKRTIDLQGVALTEEKLWDNLYYYMDRVLPVAEANDIKLALHPDDPPMSPLYNVPRILTSPEAYDRLFDAYPSESNGMCFCQGNFALMPGDLYQTAERFAAAGKIHFVHYRDVRGTAEDFSETFHDDGPTDMARMMRIYVDQLPENAAIRPDHVPTLDGDDNTNFGYTMRGRLFAAGYIRGLMHGLHHSD